MTRYFYRPSDRDQIDTLKAKIRRLEWSHRLAREDATAWRSIAARSMGIAERLLLDVADRQAP